VKQNLKRGRCFVETKEKKGRHIMEFKGKWKKMGKAGKVGAIAAIAGGSIIAVPFIVAAGPVSIIVALSTLGGGALAAGGFGVAGGIIVTGGGAALSAALAAAISSKVLKDPELLELQNNLEEIEKLVAKIQIMEKKNLDKYKDLRDRYLKLAKFISKEIKNKKKVNRDSLRRNIFVSRDLITDLNNV
jgi:hypothetical protein